MPSTANTLLVNPTITSRGNARFPLALLNLATALDRRDDSRIIDGNVDRGFTDSALQALQEQRYDAVGISVMDEPQIAPSIALSTAIRERFPDMPIVWGGYFPTLYTDTALSAPYRAEAAPALPYAKLGDPRQYLGRSFLGRRTASHQAALGCRFRFTFCGVAAMFGGATALPTAARLERELRYLKEELGADSIQFFDHNFFDREAEMIPELSFMVAPPQDTAHETEQTFECIRELKQINPQSEIIVYVYTPLPEASRYEKDRGKRTSMPLRDLHGAPVVFPRTPQEWTRPRWVDHACHADALRRRIRDFVTVLGCRHPTAQDLRSPRWAKRGLSAVAAWRYRYRRDDRPWELNLANWLVRLRRPQISGI
ncbi:cobalamin B12-binding domain-containing protein [Xanthomonas translucens]|uniref:cobalamin B12-binding domain-containing protein n=1 Tax=Xanthomonas campestris pv. translucens TaxID=343 RepID=UPI00071E80E6|nr:cobalamin B12-binding domain-containing protein [Xanthomonas translucens]AVY66727.1 radical SAM protein [Xanthomonas translucens pv. undulosa]QEN93725.1 B12-binding domain-containing radical SAM protein [Xanthomonas translucens pv. undulosa]QEO26530.1 B12-binding domain-containing radical SAM protein [Xanthomonas translucens pv. undulosa]